MHNNEFNILNVCLNLILMSRPIQAGIDRFTKSDIDEHIDLWKVDHVLSIGHQM